MGSTIPVKYLKGGEKKKASKKEITSFLRSAESEGLAGSFAAAVLVAKGKEGSELSLCEAVSLMTNCKYFLPYLQEKAGENNDDMGMRCSPYSAIPPITLLELRQH